MLNQNVSITFKYGFGTGGSLTLRAEWVRYGFEVIGDVHEDIDFKLLEDYNDVRETYRIKLLLDFTETLWFAKFLSSKSKVIQLDGIDIEVVNDFKKAAFDLFEDSNIRSNPELLFKAKETGLRAYIDATVGYVAGPKGIAA